MADLLGGQADESGDDLEHNLDAFETDDIHRMAEEPTLVNLVNLVLIEAIQSRTSDVHVEPFEQELDGSLSHRRRAAPAATTTQALAASPDWSHQDHGWHEYC